MINMRGKGWLDGWMDGSYQASPSACGQAAEQGGQSDEMTTAASGIHMVSNFGKDEGYPAVIMVGRWEFPN
jgi:hypothetical protein